MLYRSMVIGDRRVEVKLRSARAVVRQELTVAAEAYARVLEPVMVAFAPERTGALKSSIYAHIEWKAAPVRRIVLSRGFRPPADRYGVFVDDGTGIYHIPDPHTPWIQQNLALPMPWSRHQRVLLPLNPALHWGQPPADFTGKALLATSEERHAAFRNAGRRIARRLN